MASAKDLDDYIDSLPDSERAEATSYILEKLMGEMLEAGQKITLTRSDGTVIGTLHPPVPPKREITSVMQERASKIKSGSGHSLREILSRMDNSDEIGVSGYLKGLGNQNQR